uniref:C-type lectin domain-containing protein n=1 Tax=Knipowitschia caucasica TaxID=637954 RepID=A0AAV2LW08_KNICA
MWKKELWPDTMSFALVHCVIVYKYINLKKTWDDAREYCRERHKDLAKLENTEEVKKLQIPSGNTAWIGLFDDPASWKQMTSESNSWRWSSTGTTSPGQYQNWNNVQPSGLKEYFRITSLKSWSDSQSYCRQNYQDLATIQTSAETQAVKDLLPSSSSIVWIGLYRVSWRWSDGSPSAFRSWSTGEPGNSGGSEHCGSQSQSYVWSDAPCHFKYKFVCHEVAEMRPPALPPSLPTASSGLRVRSWCFRLLVFRQVWLWWSDSDPLNNLVVDDSCK